MTGFSVLTIRLPFVICGILSIYYSFKLAEKWFNSHTALFTAVVICFLEYTLLYSQSALPYAPGMLFVILAVIYWTNYIFEEGLKTKNALMFGLFLILAAYMHYFALIFLLVVFLSGFFFIRKNKIKIYFVTFIFFLIAYAPNLPIIFYQISNPTASWLSEPSQGWFFEHIKFIFNNSSYLLYSVLAIFILSNIISFTDVKINKYHVLSILFFVLPPVYCYFFSLWVRPVFENSILIFSFVFLLFFLFSFIRTQYKTYNLIAFVALMIIGLYSSLYEKKYYSTYHYGEFRDIAIKVCDWNTQYGETNITRVINVYSPSYINYYLDRFEKPTKFALYKNEGKTDLLSLRKTIESSSTPYFLYAWSSIYNPQESYDMIRVKYPYLIKNIDYNGMAGISLYSATDSTNTIPDCKPVYYSLNGFEEKNTWDKDTSILDTSIRKYGKYSAKLDSKDEYGPSCNLIISQMADTHFSRISVSLWAYATGIFKDAQIVATLNFRDDDNQIYENYMWISSKFEYFIEKNKWGQVFFSFSIPELHSRNDELKIYVWNPDKNPLYIDNIEIKAFEK